MTATYRAMQVTVPGVLELVECEVPQPGPGEVLNAVEACGICDADASDIERSVPPSQPPRVPGHEVAGRIRAIGPEVPATWTLGQRVGVGRMGGRCHACTNAGRGDSSCATTNLCSARPLTAAMPK